MARKTQDDVSIGKFEILVTYTYARALLNGVPEPEAKEKGLVAAIMGAKARLGHAAGSHKDDDKADKQATEKKRKTSITAESFDRQVAAKLGDFFEETFLPAMKKMVEAGLSYDEVKRLLKIPATWGAKISGEKFKERVSEAIRPGERN